MCTPTQGESLPARRRELKPAKDTGTAWVTYPEFAFGCRKPMQKIGGH